LNFRSPQGGAVLTATTSNVFKILNAKSWTQERWTVLTGFFFILTLNKNIFVLKIILQVSLVICSSKIPPNNTYFKLHQNNKYFKSNQNLYGCVYIKRIIIVLTSFFSGYLNAASWSGCGTTLLFTTSTESQIYCLKFTVSENDFRFEIMVLACKFIDFSLWVKIKEYPIKKVEKDEN
jgi:hypothetical protein